MEYEYTCCPKPNIRRSSVLVGAITVTAILFGIASVDQTVFSVYFGALSSLLLFLAVVISVRFIGTRYVYKITLTSFGGELSVCELRGFFGKSGEVRSHRTVCRVSLFDIREVDTFDRTDESLKKLKKTKKSIRRARASVYNYLPDVFADEYALIKIENADGISYIKLSYDEEFIKLIKK